MLKKKVVGAAIVLGMALSPFAMAASPSDSDLSLDQPMALNMQQNSTTAVKAQETPVNSSLDLGVSNSNGGSSSGMMDDMGGMGMMDMMNMGNMSGTDNMSGSSTMNMQGGNLQGMGGMGMMSMMNMGNMSNMNSMNTMAPNNDPMGMARNMMATTTNMMMQMMNMRNQMWNAGVDNISAMPANTVTTSATVPIDMPRLILLLTQLANSLNVLQGQLNGKATDPAVTTALSQAAILVGQLSLAAQGVNPGVPQNSSPNAETQPMPGMNMGSVQGLQPMQGMNMNMNVDSSAQPTQSMPGMNMGAPAHTN